MPAKVKGRRLGRVMSDAPGLSVGGKSGCGCAAAAGQGTGALAVLGMIAFAIGLRRRGHRSRQVLRVRSR